MRDSCAFDLLALSRAAMVGRCGQLVVGAGNDNHPSQARVEVLQVFRVGENGTYSWRWRSRAEKKARGWWLDERSWDVGHLEGLEPRRRRWREV